MQTQEGMVKLIYSSTYDTTVDVGARLIEDPSVLSKSAATVFECDYKELTPDKDHMGIHLVALGDYEHYGCFFEGAPVQTAKGLVPIEQIKVGDSVLTHKNRYRNVVATFEDAYTGIQVDIEVAGLPLPIACTANHPFLVVKAERYAQAVGLMHRSDEERASVINALAESAEPARADELRPGDYLVAPCGYGYSADSCRSACRSDYDLYSTGVVLSGNRNGINPESLKRVYGTSEPSTSSDLVFWHLLGAAGHLHPDAFHLLPQDKLELLAGYFDGNGSVCPDALEAETDSLELALDLQRIAANIGISASVQSRHTLCSQRYCISVPSSDAAKIMSQCLHLGRGSALEAPITARHAYVLSPIRRIILTHVEDVRKYNIEVEEDHTYVILSQAVLNSNRNGDGFPKAACERFHSTFTKLGNVYRHHRNKDPEKRLGQIVKSAYNPTMGRIELFIHAHKEKARDELEKLASEGDIPFSMGCRVLFDRCSICNTLRKSSADPEQCDHVRTSLGKTGEDGRIVCTFNDEPNFFDISFVSRPADRIAWYLKAASDEVVDSVKLASASGIWVPDHVAIVSADAVKKLNLLHKMAAAEELYRDLAQRSPVSMRERYLWELRKAATACVRSPVLTSLRDLDPQEAFLCLAKVGAILDVASFFKYALGSSYSEIADVIPVVKQATHSIYSTLVKSGECQNVCNERLFDVPEDRYYSVQSTGLLSKLADATLIGPTRDQRIISATIKNIEIVIDNQVKIASNNNTLMINKLAERYAAYKLSAVKAISSLNKDTDTDALIAVAVAQNMIM